MAEGTTAAAAKLNISYDDPDTPLHTKHRLDFLINILTLARVKKLPKSSTPLTQRNLEEYSGLDPDFSEIHDAYLPVRPRGKISVSEWLRLLP